MRVGLLWDGGHFQWVMPLCFSFSAEACATSGVLQAGKFMS
jgi:hypothetical protein